MTTLTISTTVLKDGSPSTSIATIQTEDIDKTFSIYLKQAKEYAKQRGGTITYQSYIGSLYINYLDVKGSDIIDRLITVQ